jgi:hypothetical protein
MNTDLYNRFLDSNDTLRIYEGNTLIFSSAKEHLLPLMEYLASPAVTCGPLVVFDRIMGNAAALLSVKAGAGEVFSPLGSELAVRTTRKYGVACHLAITVPFILRADGARMCPMEKLSIGKEPDGFYNELKARMEAAGTLDSC